MITETQKLDPSLVILASADTTLSRLISKNTGAAAAGEYRDGLVKTITALQPSSTRQVVTLSPPPSAPAVEACYTVTAAPSACVSMIGDQWKMVSAAELAATQATKTSYIDTRLFFCSVTGYCPSVVGDIPVRWDAYHITAAYGDRIGSDLKAAFASIGGVT